MTQTVKAVYQKIFKRMDCVEGLGNWNALTKVKIASSKMTGVVGKYAISDDMDTVVDYT